MSTSGDRWAYLDGCAYLLGFRFFFGRGDVSVVVATVSVRVRFVDVAGETPDTEVTILVDVDAEAYWNLVSVPLKLGVDGVETSSDSTSSFPRIFVANEAFAERVRGAMSIQEVEEK